MNGLFSSGISHLKLINFYKSIFPVRKLTAEIPRVIAGTSSFPLTINLLISGQCNFSCKMCYWKTPEVCRAYEETEKLNIADIENFILGVKKYQPVVHMGGGEPFLRPDLLEIVDIIKSNKLKCLITTNGFLNQGQVLEKIVDLNIDVLFFSLYGEELTHDSITGVRGSFDKIMLNLKSVLKRKTRHTKVFVSTLVLPDNINGLKLVLKKLHSLGIDGVKIEQLNFLTTNEYNHSIDRMGCFNLKPSTFIKDSYFDKKFVNDLVNIHKDIRLTFKNFVYLKPYLYEKQSRDWYGTSPYRYRRCIFIRHSIFINYNGDIIPCQFFKDCVMGNIKKDSLESVWRSHKYRALRKNITRLMPIICMRCCKN